MGGSTREYGYAGYIRAWVQTLERVGTANFPDEALRRNLSGSVMLTVEVRRDGSVAHIDVVQSSGIAVLDDAAQQTVRLAVPFPELPRTPDGTDALSITRTFHHVAGDDEVRVTR